MAKRVLLGKDGSNYVLKVSKPGVDVIDDTINNRDYLFNSEMYRAGVIRSNSTYTSMTTSGVQLPTTSDANGNPYIPAYIVTEKGAMFPTGFFNQGRSYFSGFYDVYAKVIGALSTAGGGGLFQFSLNTGSNKNTVIPYYVELGDCSNPRPGENGGNYPYFKARTRASGDGDVKIQILGIPCQYGKMITDTTLFGTSVLTGSNSGQGGSGSGGVAGPPTISAVTKTARNNSNDTVAVTAANGANQTGTITYAQASTNSVAGLTFQSSNSFAHPRGTTRYYFAKQGGLTSNTVQTNSAHTYTSPSPITTPSAFTFTTKNSATAGQSYSQASTQIAGLGDGDSAVVSVSGGTVNVSSVVNGGTVTATGTAAAAPAVGQNPNSTVVTVTIGGVQGTFTINTPAPATDTDPDAFGDFNIVTASELNTVNTSTPSKTITGINTPTAVTISGNGTFSIAGGAYGTTGNISNNQSITVRLTSSGSYSTAVSTTLTIGNKQGIYTVTTRAQAQATTPTFQGVTLQTNTSSSSQTVRATAVVQSGNTLQIKVGSGGSWANATSTYSSDFSQNRNTSVTYYFRAVSTDGHISSEVSASFYIPFIHTVESIPNISFANGSHDNTYSVTSSLNGSAAGLYTSKSFSITESASWITATIANSTTGTMRLQISANTGIARSANVTYTISSTNGGPNVSASFTVSQAAVTPPVTAIWEVNIAQGAYSPAASFNSQGYHPFTGGGHGSFSNTTNTIASINSGGGNWAFSDIESSNQNTIFLIFTSSAANSGWTTLKVYNGTNTSGTLLGTFTRTSLTYTGTGGTAAWNLGSDVTTNTGNRFLQFS